MYLQIATKKSVYQQINVHVQTMTQIHNHAFLDWDYIAIRFTQ